MSVIANFVFPAAEETAHFSDQVKMRLILQLINGISRVLQKLCSYFNGTATSTFFVLPLSGVFPVILILDLNDLDSVIYYLAHLYNIPINVLMFLNNYQCILLNYTLASQHLYLLHYLFEYY